MLFFLIHLFIFFRHIASQQTNFGCVRTSQFPEPGSLEKFRMYITAFASISSNQNRGSFDSDENLHHQSGIDVEEKILFHIESHVFADEKFESKSEGCTNSYD